MAQTYSIGDMAREFEVTTRTIRFYESEGLLAPSREGQRRVYRRRDRARLRLILRGRRVGFTLAEIREIIDLYDAPAGEAGQLHFLLEKIAERRDQLEQTRAEIDLTLKDLDTVAATCRVRLRQLGQEGTAGRPRRSVVSGS